jgi:hypothetical protein
VTAARAERVRKALGPLPGRLESHGQVKRRLLVVAVVAALAVSGTYAVMNQGSGGAAPFTKHELQDLSGLPHPPVHYVQDKDGTYRELTPEEYQKLQELQELVKGFPAPQVFESPSPGAPSAKKKAKG